MPQKVRELANVKSECVASSPSHRPVQPLLHSDEQLPDGGDVAQGGPGVGEGVVLQVEQAAEFGGVELVGAGADVLVEDEAQEVLLGGVVGGEIDLDGLGAVGTGDEGGAVGDVGEDVEEVGLFAVNHGAQVFELGFREAALAEFVEELAPGVGVAPNAPEFVLGLEEGEEFAEQVLDELLG